ncbi:phosphoribosylamine--glycine ligase [Candidatus Viadribacter manganicus]|uniref:Phosphoribosylamine--glycine ligase n=1 Tax=Candidatus Viadribacter manganicus TaxID=1759059 RepID=A0A1B1AEU7_9PROT|nr:phosphoribosylamine--glycine ligase [Candidatus Viadribacter manganicus]ANP45093.1 phosphoribosylamine--glycine ligase [Candidatus Viadribacter manganicus]
MKILIVGSGGREHALGWKLQQSPLVSEVISAPGNPGLAAIGRTVAIKAEDARELAAFALREQIGLVVIGPEAAAAAGLADALKQVAIPCFGPSKAAAQLEASKAFMKEFCVRHGVPTAEYKVFDEAIRAKAYLGDREAPFVIKADGLAAGKGVVIAETRREADAAIDEILFMRKFGTAGQRIVIEDFLPGEEASFFAICDGETAIPMVAAQDHKRAYDGDKGPNTGGMGAYSPAPIFTDKVRDQTMEQIILPTLRGMKAEGNPFVGVLFAGLMITPAGPKLIEFNVRFGDPECQTMMRRLTSDFAPVLLAAAKGELAAAPPLEWDARPAVTVVYAAQGYPDEPLKGSVIRGVPQADTVPDVVVFHAGTRMDSDGLLRADGGRVLNVTATGATLQDAVNSAYAGVNRIDWPGGFCRRDIAWRALT